MMEILLEIALGIDVPADHVTQGAHGSLRARQRSGGSA